MDLEQLDIPDTTIVHLEFPGKGKLYEDGEPTTIELFSPASDQAIAFNRMVQRKVNNRMAKRGIKALTMTPEETEQRNIERLCAYTASVNNLIYGGDYVTVDTVQKLYENPKMGWLTEQLSERLASWDDFLA